MQNDPISKLFEREDFYQTVIEPRYSNPILDKIYHPKNIDGAVKPQERNTFFESLVRPEYRFRR